MRSAVQVVMLVVMCGATGCEPTITDPCPGQRTCPGDVCCETGYPYQCGTQCFRDPCGPDQRTCINVDRTDGCYGGVWKGSYTGTHTPTGGSGQPISGAIQFDVSDHMIVVTQPSGGSGSLDCDSGNGSFTVSGTMPYMFRGTWMHTESRGDMITSATFSLMNSDGTASGTWEAVRIE